MTAWEPEPTSHDPPMLLKAAEAERLTGIRAGQLRRYAEQPGGPALVKLSTRQVLFDRRDLLAFISRRTVKVPSSASRKNENVPVGAAAPTKTSVEETVRA